MLYCLFSQNKHILFWVGIPHIVPIKYTCLWLQRVKKEKARWAWTLLQGSHCTDQKCSVWASLIVVIITTLPLRVNRILYWIPVSNFCKSWLISGREQNDRYRDQGTQLCLTPLQNYKDPKVPYNKLTSPVQYEYQ